MTTAALQALAATCSVPETKFAALASLSTTDLDALNTVIEEALHREDARVDQGLEEALGMVPRPLRGRARSLLFPERPRA